MVEKIKAIKKQYHTLAPATWHRDMMGAIDAALAEADRFLAEVQRKDAQLARANERAEQAGADWTRAKFAWRRRGDLVRSAFFADDFAILDQFFGGGEGEG
jgi:hypothetical protein